jgi:hypothetical protein
LVDKFIPKDLDQQLLAAKELVKDKTFNVVKGFTVDARTLYDVHIRIPFPADTETDSNEWLKSIIIRVQPMVEMKLYRHLHQHPASALNIVFHTSLDVVTMNNERRGSLCLYYFAAIAK